jgi:hypothetical protein
LACSKHFMVTSPFTNPGVALTAAEALNEVSGRTSVCV